MVQENKRILYHTFGQKLAYMPTSPVDIRIDYFDVFLKKMLIKDSWEGTE